MSSSALLLVATFVSTLNGFAAAAYRQSGDIYTMSDAQMDAWLANTTAIITNLNDLTSSSSSARIIWCDRRVAGGCGGSCTVYNGNVLCLPTSQKTQCMAATSNVAWCTGETCDGWCNELQACMHRLDDGFCWTPGAGSVQQGLEEY
ncbi:hypothetical protein BDV98DRAFT_589984 [Pterulicium gracile]|uniref:Uncharacterized protein n=1 Tax=Pterulicium gracile TaxID=1884261 RepID=A0A5C3QTF5_9AGAR|nr:hypothetical protein BDV98DRAFT_589984 [Pterula gracilis]